MATRHLHCQYLPSDLTCQIAAELAVEFHRDLMAGCRPANLAEEAGRVIAVLARYLQILIEALAQNWRMHVTVEPLKQFGDRRPILAGFRLGDGGVEPDIRELVADDGDR